jgi:hypothetical protein
MKKIFAPFIAAALVVGNSFAILIPVSALRSVSASGTTQGQSYSQNLSSTSLGVFDESVSGSLGVNQVNNFYAASEASQRSGITEDGFLLDIMLDTNTWVPLTAPPGETKAQASSSFEYSFQTLEPLAYEMVGSYFTFNSLPPTTLAFSLLGSTGSVLTGSFFGQSGDLRSGIILPDTYTFRVDSAVAAREDPLGDFRPLQANIAFNTASVPDAGETWILLAGAFGVLLIGRKVILPL